jgi:hypothetical protein
VRRAGWPELDAGQVEGPAVVAWLGDRLLEGAALAAVLDGALEGFAAAGEPVEVGDGDAGAGDAGWAGLPTRPRRWPAPTTQPHH